MTAGKHVVRATLHDTTHVKVVDVEERSDRDAKQVGSAQLLRKYTLRRKSPASLLARQTSGIVRAGLSSLATRYVRFPSAQGPQPPLPEQQP